MNGLRVQLDNAVPGLDAPGEAQFEQWAVVVSKHLKYNGNLTVRIVSSEEMTQLNRRYRGKDGTTNVLSFEADKSDIPAQALSEHEELRDFLGDIAICAETVATESSAQNKLIEAHWAHLFAHGVLHLCGYDHMHEAEAILMEDLETRILLAMGYASPYYVNDENKNVS